MSPRDGTSPNPGAPDWTTGSDRGPGRPQGRSGTRAAKGSRRRRRRHLARQIDRAHEVALGINAELDGSEDVLASETATHQAVARHTPADLVAPLDNPDELDAAPAEPRHAPVSPAPSGPVFLGPRKLA